jgi:peptidoglycan/xylan/chitin deacetylase (PgdA/CDA1 family)
MSTIIPILLYHGVSDHARDHWTVSRAAFNEHVRAIRDSCRPTLTITELAEAIRGRAVPANAMCVTFDDGFADSLTAAEQLAGHGIRSTVFATIDFLGRSGMLDTSGIVALDELPESELGAHAVRHVRLDEISTAEIAHEVQESKQRLESITGHAISSFAYPHGAYDRRVRRAVVAAGYSAGAAVKNAVSHPGDDPFALARVTVTAGTRAERIEDVLAGRGVPVAWRRERLRTIGYRHTRRVRHALVARRGVRSA